MAEYFKKVMVSERRPKEKGVYQTEVGPMNFDPEDIYQVYHWKQAVEWWLYESKGNILTDEELKETKRTEAIKFLETIRSYEHENRELIAFDERSSEELYDLYLTTKEDGK